MSLRVEVYEQLKKEGQKGDIVVPYGAGKRAREGFQEAITSYTEARRGSLMYELLHFRGAMLGSARMGHESEDYTFITELTKQIVLQTQADIVTGGGPGFMEGANKGVTLAQEEAKKRGRIIDSRSYGVNIVVPYEKQSNPYVSHDTRHEEFSTRIQEMMDFTTGWAYFGKGGVGTQLELLAFLQAKQVHHLEKEFKLILDPFWGGHIRTSRKTMLDERVEKGLTPLVNNGDLDLKYSDNIPEIIKEINESYAIWKRNIGDHVRYEQPKVGAERQAIEIVHFPLTPEA